MISHEAERQELERAIELLGRTTRPGRMLAYIGAKYFEQQGGQLTEFNIATEVFGRSPKTFDAAQDAVVRVEAHRLRKKLRDIYAKEGGTGLKISLPAGSYVPRFAADSHSDSVNIASSSDASMDSDLAHVDARSRRRHSLYLVSVAALIGASVLGFVMVGKS